jgi:digeranylgeranylglycerophospholipid reductase
MRKKVAVIGTGPGGLYAAREAASYDMSVTVFEKGTVGENICCAEGFFDLLKLLAEPVAGIHFKVQELIVTVKDRFTLDSSKLNLWMIDRTLWQQALAREAAKLGCTFYENTPVTPQSFEQLKREFDWVIDASGATPVSTSFLDLEPVRFAQTAQYTLQGDFSALWGKIKAVAEPHYCGYYWIFPKSKEMANVGLGWLGRRPQGVTIASELKRIIAKEGLSHCVVISKAGGPIPVSRRKVMVYGNVLLVGNAAGLGSPLHGGGIDTACISGTLAAQALAEGNPAYYCEAVETVLGGRLNLEKKIVDLWNQMDFDTLNEFMALSFGKSGSTSRLKKIKQAVTQEAAVIQYVIQGRVCADWKKGISLNGLPLLTRHMLHRIMDGDGA